MHASHLSSSSIHRGHFIEGRVDDGQHFVSILLMRSFKDDMSWKKGGGRRERILEARSVKKKGRKRTLDD